MEVGSCKQREREEQVSERYEVHAIRGFPIAPSGRTNEPLTSYAVLDSWYCYREVALPRVYRTLREQAERLADALNAQHRAWLRGIEP